MLRFEPAEVAVVVAAAVAETQLLSAESRPVLSALWVSRPPFEGFEVAAAETEPFAELLNVGYRAERHVARDGCVLVVVVKLEHRYEFDVAAEPSAVAEFGPAAAERSAELAEQPAERRQPGLPVDYSVPSMG